MVFFLPCPTGFWPEHRSTGPLGKSPRHVTFPRFRDFFLKRRDFHTPFPPTATPCPRAPTFLPDVFLVSEPSLRILKVIMILLVAP